MSSYHPLTEKVWALLQRPFPSVDISEIDDVVTEHLPKTPEVHDHKNSYSVRMSTCCGFAMEWRSSKLERCHWIGERWASTFVCLNCGSHEFEDPSDAPRPPHPHRPLTCCSHDMEMIHVVIGSNSIGRVGRIMKYECQVCGTTHNTQDF